MTPVKTYTIKNRRRIEVNTDPQRRCYEGYHHSSEQRWTPWEILETGMPEKRLEFWRELNAYAVSQRGQSALMEFEAVPE